MLARLLRRLFLIVAAVGAIGAAAAVTVFASAFAVYAALRPFLGPPFAAAAVVGIFALAAIVIAVTLARLATRGLAGELNADEALDILGRISALVRDRPIVSALVALVLGVTLIRSPKSIGEVARAFFETLGGDPPRRPKA